MTRRTDLNYRPTVQRAARVAIVMALVMVGTIRCNATDLEDYLQLRGPAPTETFRYGSGASQMAEFFRPRGDGPFPVVVLIHGGCWLSRYQGLRQFQALAGVLAREGVAVWNVGYRGIDEPGGGYPGTYQDIAASLGELDRQADRLRLDMHRVIAIGHSAGAHLALWAAARPEIPSTSPLYTDDPTKINEVVALGALADLRGDADAIEQSCGVNPAVLTGSSSASRSDVYADTSPAQMLPIHAKVVFVNGENDAIASPALATRFVELARRAGMDASTVTVAAAGHFDEVTPSTPAWTAINKIILQAVRAPSDHD